MSVGRSVDHLLFDRGQIVSRVPGGVAANLSECAAVRLFRFVALSFLAFCIVLSDNNASEALVRVEFGILRLRSAYGSP